MYFVYILKSIRTGDIYKGLTEDLDRRIKEHERGKCKSTKLQLPLELVHVEICGTRLEARKLEIFFKSGYGREIINDIISYQADVAKLVDAHA